MCYCDAPCAHHRTAHESKTVPMYNPMLLVIALGTRKAVPTERSMVAFGPSLLILEVHEMLHYDAEFRALVDLKDGKR